MGSVIGGHTGLLLNGFAKAYHKMQPQQHSGDQDVLKIALQNDSVVAMLMWYCEFVI